MPEPADESNYTLIAPPRPATTTPVDPNSDPRFPASEHPGDLGRLGRYRILKRIGAGGMGAVYLGFDEALQRKIAIKVLSAKQSADPDSLARFMREARTAAAVHSDHVVTTHDVDAVAGVPFIAMEYLQGIPLDRYLVSHPGLAVEQIVRIATEVARGLAAAHEVGLVHRDIKPSNLWLESPQGRVKILDFGLAKEMTPTAADAHDVTRTGDVLGTPAYMSPEQARAQPVDHRTDLFSFGAVLYELCTGRKPFTGATVMAVLMALGTEDPTPVRELNPNVPESLAALVHRLLAKYAVDRPPSANAVLDTLLAISSGTVVLHQTSTQHPVVYVPITVAPQAESVWERMASADDTPEAAATRAESKLKVKPKPLPWLAIGSAVAVLLAVGILLLVMNPRKPKPPPDVAAEPLPRPVVKPPVKPKDDPERKVAEWLTAHEGTLSVQGVGDALLVYPRGTPVLPSPLGAIVRIHLDLGCLFADDDIDQLRALPALKALLVAKSEVTDAGLEKLTRLPAAPTLEELAFITSKISDQGLKQLPRLPKLHSLEIGSPLVTGDGFLALAVHCPNLTRLAVIGVPLDQCRFADLRGFEKLRKLSFHKCAVADEQWPFLAAALTLEDLELTGVPVGDAGLEQIARMKSLTQLRLTTSKATHNGVMKFKAMKPDCVVISDVYKPELDPNRVAAAWAADKGGRVWIAGPQPDAPPEQFPNQAVLVTRVAFDVSKHQLTDADLDRLAPLSHLRAVTTTVTQLTDDGLEKWSKFPMADKYEEIGLIAGNVTDKGLKHVKRFRSLVSFHLTGGQITGDGLAAFTDLPALRRLTFDTAPLNDAGLKYLAGTKLTDLMLLNCPNVGDDGLKTLAAIATLTNLNLYKCGVGDGGLKSLSAAKNLKTLNVSGTKVTAEGVATLRKALPDCAITSDFPKP